MRTICFALFYLLCAHSSIFYRVNSTIKCSFSQVKWLRVLKVKGYARLKCHCFMKELHLTDCSPPSPFTTYINGADSKSNTAPIVTGNVQMYSIPLHVKIWHQSNFICWYDKKDEKQMVQHFGLTLWPRCHQQNTHVLVLSLSINQTVYYRKVTQSVQFKVDIITESCVSGMRCREPNEITRCHKRTTWHVYRSVVKQLLPVSPVSFVSVAHWDGARCLRHSFTINILLYVV